MIYGFNDDKSKCPVVPCGGVVDRSGNGGTVIIEGNDYIDHTAEKDGLVFCEMDTAMSDAVVRTTGTTGAFMNLRINDYAYGNFYVGPGERTYQYSPAFPVKNGDYIKLSNGYSDTTVGLRIWFLSFEEID